MNTSLKIWRGSVVFLLFVAILGPWVFDRINVPAQYTCEPPNIRLEGDFCGAPMSGMWILSALAGELLSFPVGLISGAARLEDTGRILLVFLVGCLMLLPIFTTLRLVVGRARRRQQAIAVAAWLLAVAAMGVYWIAGRQKPHGALWGSVLYTALVLCGLLVEGAWFALGKDSTSN